MTFMDIPVACFAIVKVRLEIVDHHTAGRYYYVPQDIYALFCGRDQCITFELSPYITYLYSKYVSRYFINTIIIKFDAGPQVTSTAVNCVDYNCDTAKSIVI